MPCNSIITTTLDLSKANADVIADALESLGMTIESQTNTSVFARKGIDTVEWNKGQGTAIRSRSTSLTDSIPAAYAQSAIKKAAKKQGWKWKQDRANTSKFAISRR